MKPNYIAEGCHSITPYLTAPDAARFIEFLKQAFGAVELARITRPDGAVMHAQARIGDSMVMIGQPPPNSPPRSNMLYHYVPDVDATYQQALKCGAVSMVEPANMFYGDRHACVKDMAGNEWWIATHLEDMSLEELQRRADAFAEQMSKKK